MCQRGVVGMYGDLSALEQGSYCLWRLYSNQLTLWSYQGLTPIEICNDVQTDVPSTELFYTSLWLKRSLVAVPDVWTLYTFREYL